MNASVLWDIVSRAKTECHEAAGRLLFTFKSFKKTLANNTEKKIEITYVLDIMTFRISTSKTITGCQRKKPPFTFLVFKIKLQK